MGKIGGYIQLAPLRGLAKNAVTDADEIALFSFSDQEFARQSADPDVAGVDFAQFSFNRNKTKRL